MGDSYWSQIDCERVACSSNDILMNWSFVSQSERERANQGLVLAVIKPSIMFCIGKKTAGFNRAEKADTDLISVNKCDNNIAIE